MNDDKNYQDGEILQEEMGAQEPSPDARVSELEAALAAA